MVYVLSFAGPGNVEDIRLEGHSSAAINLEPGLWNVTVRAYYREQGGILAGTGTGDAEVVAGSRTSVNIRIMPEQDFVRPQEPADNAIQIHWVIGNEPVVLSVPSEMIPAFYKDRTIQWFQWDSYYEHGIEIPGALGETFTPDFQGSYFARVTVTQATTGADHTWESIDTPRMVVVYPDSFGLQYLIDYTDIPVINLPAVEFDMNYSVYVNRDVTLRAGAGGTTLVRANNTYSMFDVYGGNGVESILTLSGGVLPNGELVLDGSLEENLTIYHSLIQVMSGILNMNAGVRITGNNNSDSDSYYGGGGVFVAQGGTFNMNGGTISGNRTAGNGGGVFVAEGGTFTKTGGTIFGSDADADYANTAEAGLGQAVFAEPNMMRNMTAGPDVELHSSDADHGGWEEQGAGITIRWVDFKEGAPELTGPTVRIMGTENLTGTVTVTDPDQFSNIRWFFNNEEIENGLRGAGVSGNGSVLTLNAGFFGNRIGDHEVTVRVIKDGQPYSGYITFSVVWQ